MNISEICNRQVAVARRNESLLEAARRMREFHVGCLVVVEEEGEKRIPVGLLTDRDILMEVLAEGVPLEKISVEDVMASPLATAREQDGIYETIQQMRRKGVRRIPIVDEGQSLVGILTMDDLLELLSEEMSHLSSIFSRGREFEAMTRP
ncbi:MAG: CBS domain-containing protein [bacterium]